MGLGGEMEGDADTRANGDAVAGGRAETPAANGGEGGGVEGLAAGDGDLGVPDGAVTLDGDEDLDGGVDALRELVRGIDGVDVLDDRGKGDVGLASGGLGAGRLGKRGARSEEARS